MHLFMEAELAASRAILRTVNEQQYTCLRKMGSSCPLYIFVAPLNNVALGEGETLKYMRLIYITTVCVILLNKQKFNQHMICLVSTHSPKDI